MGKNIDYVLFRDLHEVPDCLGNYLDCFYSDWDVEFVNAFGKGELTAGEFRAKTGLSEAEAARDLHIAYKDFLINKKETADGEVCYFLDNFYNKMDYECKRNIEKYLAIPRKVREALDQWCIDEYKVRQADYFNGLKNGTTETREAFLNYDEIDEYFKDTKHAVVFTCNCRILHNGCDKPVQACIRCDGAIDERTFGKNLNRDEVIAAVKDLRKAGLMQNVEADWRNLEGKRHMCNCCDCCCYPMRVEQEMDIRTRRVRVAVWDSKKCNHCGACINRCNFGVFAYTGKNVSVDGELRQEIAFDSRKCWGCSICVDTCEVGALSMRDLRID